MLNRKYSGFTLCSDISFPASLGMTKKESDILNWQISQNLKDGSITPSTMETKCSVPAIPEKRLQTSNDNKSAEGVILLQLISCFCIMSQKKFFCLLI